MKWLPLICLLACGTPSDDVVGPFTGPVHRFVVDRFSLPITSTDARAIGDDLDGDGRVDNQLGSALSSLAANENLTLHADDMIASGVLASVIEVQADDLLSDPTVGVRYLGREGDVAALVGGSIVDRVFHPNPTRSTHVPGMATLRLPAFADIDPSVIALEGMELDFTPDETGVFVRIRGGVIGADALEVTAQGLIDMYEANPPGHPYLMSLFDKNQDGVMALDEVKQNSLITSLLAPDVELRINGDFVKRLSFGFAVHARPCATGNCALATPEHLCFDRTHDGDETGLDCGGSCLACRANQPCSVAADCQSQICSGVCAAPSCTDGVMNGNETDKDCGWNCGPCALGLHCRRNADCMSGRCGDYAGMNDICW